MMTAEFKVNGAIVAILHTRNTGMQNGEDVAYDYEYYEPEVGIVREHIIPPSHIRGTAMANPNLGLRHVMCEIMKSITQKTQNRRSNARKSGRT